MSDEDNKDKETKRVVNVVDILEHFSRVNDPQKLVNESEQSIKEKFVWKDEFQDIMWAFHDHLRQHNYGLLHRAIHDMLDHYELEQPPDAE